MAAFHVRRVLSENLHITKTALRLTPDGNDGGKIGKARLKRARHIDIIEATEARRHEQNLSTAVAQDVADLRLAKDWDDGIADKAADTTSQVDYRGFEPVGKDRKRGVEGMSVSVRVDVGG